MLFMSRHIQKEQIALLSDEDVIRLHLSVRSVLRDRGILSKINGFLKKERNNIDAETFNTPPLFERGSIKRLPHESILLTFMDEDWSYLFSGNYDESKDYYVYYHSDPSKANMRFRLGDKSILFNGKPFYIGKGKGLRYKSRSRSRSHLSVIDFLESSGYLEDQIFHIFAGGLTEKEALIIESKLITFFGCSSEIDPTRTHFHGLRGGLLVNSDISVRPKCVDKMIRRR